MKTRTKKSRTRLTPEQQEDADRKMLADFDAAHPVGSKCWYWTTLPFGPVRETTIRRESCIMPSGEPVCFVDGVSGCVSIWHISDVDESRRDQVKFVSEIAAPSNCDVDVAVKAAEIAPSEADGR